jgi:hypothetical protein
MTAPKNKPPEEYVLQMFRDYLRENAAWGSLHIVLEDGNIKDSHVEYCIQHARDIGDMVGVTLGGHLLKMSKSQRLSLGNKL